jgi:serine/threonine-protein kinase
VATDARGHHYALRKLKSQFRFDFVTRRRFQRGCDILSRIHNHQHVIQYFEHGKIEGTLYCLMEHVEGTNLKQLFARQDSVLQDFLGNILIDMAIALEHVHDSGFMHLDFKPENVLVSRNGNVKLVDFDLARPRPPKPAKSSRNPGTPAYMAPEQLLRKPYDHRADIYAFGVTAYELLTGQKPFFGESPHEILRKQMDRTTSFATPRELNPDIPFNLEKPVLKCLDQDPEKRYPIMSVLVHELESALYV